MTCRSNHFPSPLFSVVESKGNVTVEAVDGVVEITQVDAGKTAYIEYTAHLKPGAEYVFSFHYETGGDWDASKDLLWPYTSKWGSFSPNVYVGAGEDKDVEFTFRAPSDGVCGFRFYARPSVRISRPQLELAETYETAVAGGGLRFFSGSTMPMA